MLASLLLRDAQERIVGYVLTDGAQLCIRVSGAGQSAIATISDGTRNKTTVSVCCDGREEHMPWQSDRNVAGVSIWQEGRMVAAGGELPKDANPTKDNLSKKEEQMRKKGDAIHVYKKEEKRAVPSLRWPPPPCWQTARYSCGDWIEDDSDEEE